MFVSFRDLVDAPALVVPIHFTPACTVTVNIFTFDIEQALKRSGMNPFRPIFDSWILPDIEFFLVRPRDEDVVNPDIGRVELHGEVRKIVYVRHQHITEHLRCHHFESLQGIADRRALLNLVQSFFGNRFFCDIQHSEAISSVIDHGYLPDELPASHYLVVDRINAGRKNLDENPDNGDQDNRQPRPYRKQGHYPVLPLYFFEFICHCHLRCRGQGTRQVR